MSTENIKSKRYDEIITSSNINSYIGERLRDISNENKSSGYWRLYDKSDPKEDGDQIRAVFGICFMIGVLFTLGCYSFFG